MFIRLGACYSVILSLFGLGPLTSDHLYVGEYGPNDASLDAQTNNNTSQVGPFLNVPAQYI